MTLQEKIAAILDDPVFGGELWYIKRPATNGVTVPDIFGVFSIVGGERVNRLSGTDSISRPRVQISIFCGDSTTLIEKVAAIEAAMLAANIAANEAIETNADFSEVATVLSNVPVSVPVDGFESDTGLYYSHLDFYCWIRG